MARHKVLSGNYSSILSRRIENPDNLNEKARHLDGLFNMVHSGGFEPPTARFVAEYSIQLSYECDVEARILLIDIG
jgi:hypothetical protein